MHVISCHLFEGSHLLLHSVHKPPLHHKTVKHTKTGDYYQPIISQSENNKLCYFSYWMYSPLFSLVTTISAPSGFSSCWWVWTGRTGKISCKLQRKSFFTPLKVSRHSHWTLNKPVRTGLHQWWTSNPSPLGRSAESTSRSWNIHCPVKVKCYQVNFGKIGCSLQILGSEVLTELFAVEECDTHNRLHVLEGDRLLQHHLVERPNEESFEEHKQKCQHIVKSQNLLKILWPLLSSCCYPLSMFEQSFNGNKWKTGFTHRQAVFRDTQPCLPHDRWTWSRTGGPRYINLS